MPSLVRVSATYVQVFSGTVAVEPVASHELPPTRIVSLSPSWKQAPSEIRSP